MDFPEDKKDSMMDNEKRFKFAQYLMTFLSGKWHDEIIYSDDRVAIVRHLSRLIDSEATKLAQFEREQARKQIAIRRFTSSGHEIEPDDAPGVVLD